MADEDEDLSLLRGGTAAEEIDPTDETQDFRFINSLNIRDTSSLSLPKRGEKDFESHETKLQLSTLEASRQAMHNVLSWDRVHNPKNHILAMYDPDSNMAYAIKTKSQLFQTIGRHMAGKEWLLPEEALFLIERGSLDCRWPVKKEKDDDAEARVEDGPPMSLQGAYAAFIGFEGGVGGKLTQEMYSVYAGLRRSGYIVFRTGSWDDDRAELQPSTYPKEGGNANWLSRFFGRVWKMICSSELKVSAESLRFGPLVKPGLYRSYADIYRLLQIIPTHDHRAPPAFLLPPDVSNPYRLTFDVWKTASKFKKSARSPPDFRIAVINAHETNIPTAAQMNDLLATTPYDPPTPAGTLYGKLKHGMRNVVLAVVDNGVPSYMRVSDAPFADELLYEQQKPLRGGKGGGRGRGGKRGRGRGRGRGG